MNNHDRREGVLFVVSAPSGAGKTSLCRELIDKFPDLRQSISFTTRAMRENELAGVDYHFVTTAVFRQMIADQLFAEWAEVHGNLYGTALKTLEQAMHEGDDLLLDIDCQGAAQLKKNYHRGVFIFILPPDMAILEQRLRDRATDDTDVIRQRLLNAKDEIKEAVWYDYLVVNDNFVEAQAQLKAIISAERNRVSRNRFLLNRYLITGD